MLKISARPQYLMTDQTKIQATQLPHKKQSIIQTLINKATFPIVGFSLILAAGCSQDVEPPQPGEYGKKLVQSVTFPAEIIDELNSTTMPFPDQFFKSPDLGIVYKASADKSPYRFVIVARGTAIKDGKVDLVWTTGTRRETDNIYRPAIYSDDDVDKYNKGEPILLVIPSEPFSVENAPIPIASDLKTTLDLSKRDNFKFSSIELQVWEGEGSKKDWGKYLMPFSLFLSLLLIAYGMHTKIMNRL